VATPVSPRETGQQPEGLVPGTEAWPLARGPLARGPGQHHELLAQQEVPSNHIAASAHARSEDAHKEAQGLEHRPRMMTLAGSKRSHRVFRPHKVRDVVFGEDASTTHTGTALQALAALRNLVLSLLRLWHRPAITAARQAVARHRAAVFRLLALPRL
jgi:hypothetical protein